MKCVFLTILIKFTVLGNLSSQVIPGIDSVPVRVSYFTAAQFDNKTRLDWKVACYLNYANFEIQRSTNGRDFATINSFTADRLRCLAPFVFDDKIAFTRTYYRLKVGDRDGRFSASKVLVAFGRDRAFEIIGSSPNPVTTHTVVNISSAENGMADISFTNYQGFVAKRLNITLHKGANDVKMNLNDLPGGSYIIRVVNAASDIRLSKIVKL